MKKTAVGAPAPRPSPKEILDAIDKMDWHQLDDLNQKIQERVYKRGKKISDDRFKNSEY